MTTLKFKRGKEFLWAIARDKNEIYVKGKRFHRIIIEEESAQKLIDSI
jgi:hypothetical protein